MSLIDHVADKQFFVSCLCKGLPGRIGPVIVYPSPVDGNICVVDVRRDGFKYRTSDIVHAAGYAAWLVQRPIPGPTAI